LDHSTSVFDFPFSLSTNVASPNDNGNVDSALAEEFCVTVGEEVEDGRGIRLRGGVEVFVTVRLRNKREKLR